MRVLIADDHELLRDALAAFLQHAGISTEAASDLPDALARVGRSGPFELILLDLAMPGMNGLEGLQQAIAANRGRPVALISGAARPETARQALALGAAGVLEKTLSAGDLVAAVHLMAKGGNWAQEAGERPPPIADPARDAGSARLLRWPVQPRDRGRTRDQRTYRQAARPDPVPQAGRGEPHTGRNDRARDRAVLRPGFSQGFRRSLRPSDGSGTLARPQCGVSRVNGGFAPPPPAGKPAGAPGRIFASRRKISLQAYGRRWPRRGCGHSRSSSVPRPDRHGPVPRPRGRAA